MRCSPCSGPQGCDNGDKSDDVRVCELVNKSPRGRGGGWRGGRKGHQSSDGNDFMADITNEVKSLRAVLIPWMCLFWEFSSTEFRAPPIWIGFKWANRNKLCIIALLCLASPDADGVWLYTTSHMTFLLYSRPWMHSYGLKLRWHYKEDWTAVFKSNVKQCFIVTAGR